MYELPTGLAKDNTGKKVALRIAYRVSLALEGERTQVGVQTSLQHSTHVHACFLFLVLESRDRELFTASGCGIGINKRALSSARVRYEWRFRFSDDHCIIVYVSFYYVLLL